MPVLIVFPVPPVPLVRYVRPDCCECWVAKVLTEVRFTCPRRFAKEERRGAVCFEAEETRRTHA